jgi:hypothetical protein
MAHKTIDADGSTIMVSDNEAAEKLNPESLVDKIPISVVGGPQELGEVKIGSDAILKGRSLQRYETLRESNTQFFCEITFVNHDKQEKKKKIIDGILYSFICEDTSKVIGLFLDLHSALGIIELFADSDYVAIAENVSIGTTKEKYKFEKIGLLNYLEIREIVGGTALVMISFT